MADAVFAWLVEEADGQEGIVASMALTGAPPVPMVTTREHIAHSENWRALAQAHATGSGRPVRLVRFDRHEVLEEI